jgi:hypothetical protein
LTLSELDEEANYQIEISNLLGQTVFKSNLEPLTTQIISGLGTLKGIYICKVLKQGKEILSEKIVFKL